MIDDRQEEDIDPAEKDDALFVNLILIFQGAAMQQMGKILNPLTGKIEKNIEQARFSIDTLAMLREKTRGNLSDDLERFLDSRLLNLRMNFVEESAKEADAGEKPGAGGTEPQAPEESRTVGEPASPSGAGLGGAEPGTSGAGTSGPKGPGGEMPHKEQAPGEKARESGGKRTGSRTPRSKQGGS
ncbi:MAG TPA: DUF1844 domain-containing protein [bacterium]|nr:DUF1844 domain-containing protein [bacterium]